MKYPIGIQSFEKLREEGYLYVDKTDLVWQVTRNGICFLCRPRRFGKSLLVSTIEAYFQAKRSLFEGLKIMQLEKEWLPYPVFCIDFAGVNFNKPKALENHLNAVVSTWEEQYGRDPYQQDLGQRMLYVLKQAHQFHGRRCVVLVDEYDKPLLDVLNDNAEVENRDILKAFYATFKTADEHLRFVLLTGVTKFSQVSVFSGFNQPYDLSMDGRYDTLCGISEDELYGIFSAPIREMAARFNISELAMKQMLKRQYDGYHFSDRMTDVYNPFSIINCLQQQRLQNYWFRSGTPSYLVKLLEGHRLNLQTALERSYRPETFIDYRADVQQPIPMLYQSGYLTISEADGLRNLYRLDFPNNEVREGFVDLLATDYLQSSDHIASWLLDVDAMLREGRIDELRDSFTAFLASVPYDADKNLIAANFETHYQYTFYLILRLLSCYTTLIEKQNSHGRADLVVETPNFVYIFEFKLDGSADEALAQIEAKGYAQPYQADARQLYRIGAVVSSETRTIAEWKVEK